MNAVSFDTLKFARALQADGAFTDTQSERFVETLGEMLTCNLSTRFNSGALKSNNRDVFWRIREAELRLEAKIAETKAEIIQWFFVVVSIQTAAIIGSVVALVRSAHG